MRKISAVTILLLGVILSACSFRALQAPAIAETEPQLVQDCRLLGVLNETADADTIFQWRATQKMIARIKQRAARLGATHLVWHHRGKLSASASAYLCPAGASSKPALESKAP